MDAGGYICDAPDVWLDDQESILLESINAYRLANGVGPLTPSPTLMSAAGWMAGDMAWRNYFSHSDWFGRSFDMRQANCGNWASYRGENIAAGTNADSAQAAFNMWLNSSTHHAELLNPIYRVAGISRFYIPWSTYGWYWVLDLASE